MIGSTDKTFELCEKIKKTDERIKIISQSNNGVSKARNVGIENASGEYVVFIDADDFLEKNMLEVLISGIEKSDMAAVTYTKEEYIDNQVIFEKIYTRQQFFLEIFRNKKILGFLWNKIFRLDIIKKYNIWFDVDIHICEDMLFVLQYLQYCNDIFYTEQILYHYIQRENSALNSKNTKWISILSAYKKMLEIETFREQESILLYYYLKIIIESFEYTNEKNINEMKICIKKINFNKLNFKEKIIFLIIRINYKVFKNIKNGVKNEKK